MDGVGCVDLAVPARLVSHGLFVYYSIVSRTLWLQSGPRCLSLTMNLDRPSRWPSVSLTKSKRAITRAWVPVSLISARSWGLEEVLNANESGMEECK